MRINKLREGIQRKLRGVEEQKADIESKRESLKQQMISLERGMYSVHVLDMSTHYPPNVMGVGVKLYVCMYRMCTYMYVHVHTCTWCRCQTACQ